MSRTETEAYVLTRPEGRSGPMIFASPHSGREYPDEFLAKAVLDLCQERQLPVADVSASQSLTGRGIAGGHLAHGLVPGRVEGFALGIEQAHAVVGRKAAQQLGTDDGAANL